MGDGLKPPGKVVRAGGAITDGPFMEAKEIVGGYSIVQADSVERAAQIAKTCPEMEIEVAGHTDAEGEPGRNQRGIACKAKPRAMERAPGPIPVPVPGQGQGPVPVPVPPHCSSTPFGTSTRAWWPAWRASMACIALKWWRTRFGRR